MQQNIGLVLGRLVGDAIKQACNTGKTKRVQTRHTTYAKAGKKPMPQPAFSQHTKTANPFSSMMSAGALSTHIDDDKPVMPKKKQRTMPANGPIRGTKSMRQQ